MTLNSSQTRAVPIIVGSMGAVVLLALTWLMLVSPQLSAAESVRKETKSLAADNEMLGIKISGLKRLSGNLPKLQDELRTALASLPSDSALPELTRELTTIADATKVDLTNIDIGALTAAGTAGAPTGGASTQVAISVTANLTGPFAHLVSFLHKVESGERGATVTSAQLVASSVARTSSIDVSGGLTVQFTVYSSPMDDATLAEINKLLAATR